MQREHKYEWGEGVFTLLSWFSKQKVQQARVLVAGAGALGNEVVKNLALFGVGHIYIVDFDRIEISNLTRSVLFREEDAYNHSHKSEIVAKRAMEINPQIKVVPIVGNLASEVGFGLYKAVDVIIGCLDSPYARYLLNRLSMRAGKSWVDGSIENLMGVVRVYTPGVSCYECGLSKEQFNNIMMRTGCADVVRLQAEAGRIATTPVSASIVGAMQVQEAMKIIHTESDVASPFKTLSGKMWHFNGMTNDIRIFNNASWKRTCPSHDVWTDVIQCSDMSAEMTVAEALARLRDLLDAEEIEINMLNNKFVHKIVAERTDQEFDVRIPESKLQDYIQKNETLYLLSRRSIFHKVYYENIDADFPLPKMQLYQIGIPHFDILQVSTEKGVFFVELTADSARYDL